VRTPEDGLDTFTKIHGESVLNDWARVLSLYEASGPDAGFLAPRPLRVVDQTQSIVYGTLPPGRLFTYILTSSNLDDAARLPKIAYGIGSGLANLHARMRPTNELVLPKLDVAELGISLECKARFDLVDIPANIAALHGDFGHTNVWIGNNDEIWFLDPLPQTFSANMQASKANVYYDIGHMVSTLWALYPLRLYPYIGRFPRMLWIDAFLEGYSAGSGKKIDPVCALFYAAENLNRYGPFLRSYFGSVKGAIWFFVIGWQKNQIVKAALKRMPNEQL
jgi:hypothetical protein